ncbi:MAG: hypothetical protein QOH48_1680 [Actinomycetota bacterium]|jgi:hypothetical protein|nr:hypothetical protein [Actinomycetota bacterium]
MKQVRIGQRTTGSRVEDDLVRMKVVGVAVSIILLVLCAFGGGASASADTASAKAASSVTKTKVKVQGPFTADGHVRKGLFVGDHLLGSCWEGSVVNQQVNTYRCFSGNIIHDPCFKHAGVRDLICMRAPWSKTVQRLRLTRRLPANGSSGISDLSQPWGYKLFNGTRCVLGGGTANLVGKVLLPYECSRHHSGTRVNRSRPIWRVRVAPKSLDRLRHRRVKKAWF